MHKMWKSTQTEATPISLFVVLHLDASPSGHVFHIQSNFTNCDYVRFQVLKAVLRKIRASRMWCRVDLQTDDMSWEYILITNFDALIIIYS